MSDITGGPPSRTDEEQLADLGYKQELPRVWSSFTNFAISFTIISVLAGTFTTFGQAWNAGGPLAISIGWPVICGFVLLVAVSLAELPSAFPGAGSPSSIDMRRRSRASDRLRRRSGRAPTRYRATTRAARRL